MAIIKGIDQASVLRRLKEDFDGCKGFNEEHHSKVRKWLDAMNPAPMKVPTGKSGIVLKLIRKQAEGRYAEISEPLLNTPELYDATPVTFRDKAAAEQARLLLNNQFNTKLNKVTLVDNVSRTLVNEGTCFMRSSWEYEDEEHEIEEATYQDVAAPDSMHKELEDAKNHVDEDPANLSNLTGEMQGHLEASADAGRPMVRTYAGHKKSQKNKIKKNHPMARVCHYASIYIDPTSEGIFEDSRFIIQKRTNSLAELKQSGNYVNLDKINISTNAKENNDDIINGNDFNFKDKARKRLDIVEYWGYWSVEEGGDAVHPIVATWVGDTLIQFETSPYPDGKLPYVAIPYLPITGSVFGEPDGALIEDHQKILSATARAMIDTVAKAASGQRISVKGAFDPTNLQRFKGGEDCEVNREIGDPRAVTYIDKFPELPQSVQVMFNTFTQDAEGLTGISPGTGSDVTSNELGSTPQGANSPSSKRKLSILRRVSEGFVMLGKRFMCMNAMFLHEHEVVRITDGKYVEIHKDNLSGDIDLRLTISTAEEDNAKAQELSFMLQTMGGILPLPMTQLVLSDIARLRSMPELSKMIAEYQQPPDKMAEEKQQAEIKLIEARIAKEEAAAAYYTQKADHGKQLKEESRNKAGLMQSQKDKLDLDYLEQHNGTKHKQALEHIGEQAKGNIALENMRHINKQDGDDQAFERDIHHPKHHAHYNKQKGDNK